MQGQLFFINPVIHRTVENVDPFNIIMPVAESPSVRIAGQAGRIDVQGDPGFVIWDDLREIFHYVSINHSSTSQNTIVSKSGENHDRIRRL